MAELLAAAATARCCVVANKVDDTNREAADLGVRCRSASATRIRSAPCTAAAPATCSTALVDAACPSPSRATDDERSTSGEAGEDESSRWRSSAGRTWASPRCSTGSSARTRAVVHDMPGTTRDTIDTVVETDDGPVRFVDTAGMRRKAQDRRGAPSTTRSCGPCRPIDHGRRGPARHRRHRWASPTRTSAWPSGIDAAGCPVVVLLNKWELLDAEQREPTSTTRSTSACTSSARRRCSRSAP